MEVENEEEMEEPSVIPSEVSDNSVKQKASSSSKLRLS